MLHLEYVFASFKKILIRHLIFLNCHHLDALSFGRSTCWLLKMLPIHVMAVSKIMTFGSQIFVSNKNPIHECAEIRVNTIDFRYFLMNFFVTFFFPFFCQMYCHLFAVLALRRDFCLMYTCEKLIQLQNNKLELYA